MPSTPQSVPKSRCTVGLYTAERILEIGKSIGEAAGPASGPLKAVCGIIQTLVQIAQEIKDNDKSIKELFTKLAVHLTFLKEQASKNFGQYIPQEEVENSNWGSTLEAYKCDLIEITDALQEVKQENKGLKKVKIVRKTQGVIVDCLRKLDDSYKRFMISSIMFMVSQSTIMSQQSGSITQKLDVHGQQLQEVEERTIIAGLPASEILRPSKPHAESTCPRTLDELRAWSMNPQSKPVFALVGEPPIRRSTATATMIEEWSNTGRLGAHFYFTNSDPAKLASTLARGISDRIPGVRHRVAMAIKDRQVFTTDPISKQLEILVFSPLRDERAQIDMALQELRSRRPDIQKERGSNAIVEADTLPEEEEERVYENYILAAEKTLIAAQGLPPLLVIDALDKCATEDRTIILQSILRSIKQSPFCKFLITCSSESELYLEMGDGDKVLCQAISASKLEQSDIEEDIGFYSTETVQDSLDSSQILALASRAGNLVISPIAAGSQDAPEAITPNLPHGNMLDNSIHEYIAPRDGTPSPSPVLVLSLDASETSAGTTFDNLAPNNLLHEEVAPERITPSPVLEVSLNASEAAISTQPDQFASNSLIREEIMPERNMPSGLGSQNATNNDQNLSSYNMGDTGRSSNVGSTDLVERVGDLLISPVEVRSTDTPQTTMLVLPNVTTPKNSIQEETASEGGVQFAIRITSIDTPEPITLAPPNQSQPNGSTHEETTTEQDYSGDAIGNSRHPKLRSRNNKRVLPPLNRGGQFAYASSTRTPSLMVGSDGIDSLGIISGIISMAAVFIVFRRAVLVN